MSPIFYPSTFRYTNNKSICYHCLMTTYTGGCHCKKVQYEVAIENLDSVISCDCSICSMRGWLLTFVPSTAFTLKSGEDNLTTYHFNKNQIDHLFCKTCGTASFGKGKDPEGNEMIAVNVRCLDGVNVQSLTVTEFHGKDL